MADKTHLQQRNDLIAQFTDIAGICRNYADESDTVERRHVWTILWLEASRQAMELNKETDKFRI